MNKKTCFVIGAGGHGKVIIQLLRDLDFEVEAIFDDKPDLWGTSLSGVAVSGPIDSIKTGRAAVIAVGDNLVRSRIARSMTMDWLTVVHPTAYLDPSVELGEGTVVLPNAAVQVDARCGNHVIVNTSATLEHDCRVGDFAHLAPGTTLAGAVNIGEGVLMGVGTSTLPCVSVGDWSIVGAGSTVVHDLPKNCTATGIPARIHPQAS